LPWLWAVQAREFEEQPKRAAAGPVRSGAECLAAPGVYRPVVDPKRCEGKGDCVVVCPYDIFEVARMDDATYDAMPALVKLKLWAHGRKTAYTPNATDCQACGLCVKACPERAIRLVKVGHEGSHLP